VIIQQEKVVLENLGILVASNPWLQWGVASINCDMKLKMQQK
jgi:hypothetical protein